MLHQRGVLILLLLLQACGGMRLRALPDSAGQVDRERQAISKQVADVRVAITPHAWRHRPSRLTDDVLPLLVGIVNAGPGAVTLRLAEVRLVDDLGQTRRPFRPEEVVSLLLGGSDELAIVPSIGFEASGPEPTLFGLELGLNFNRSRDLRDIRRLAFPPDPIAAGSRAEGFIYLPKPSPEARALSLLLTLDATSGQHLLSFLFAIDK